jgi:hypothetical protein
MKSSIKLSALGSALALAGLFMVGGLAQADTVTTDYTNVSPGLSGVAVKNVAPGSPLYDQSTTAGVFNHVVKSSSPTGIDLFPAGTANFVAFCIDLQDVTGDNVVYTIVNLKDAPDPLGDNMGAAKALDLSKMLYAAVGANLSAASSLSNDQAAALQMAVWEVVFEKSGTYDIFNGNMTLSKNADVNALANGYLGGTNGPTAMSGLVGLTNPTKQDFVAQVVPIPAAAWLFGSALMGVVALGRRRMKNGAQV